MKVAPGPDVVPSKLPVPPGKREKDESGARKALKGEQRVQT